MFCHLPALQKPTLARATVMDPTAGTQQPLGSQHSTTDRQQQALSHGLPPAQRSNDIQGAASHRPKPRQPQRKGNAKGKGDGKAKEHIKGHGKGKVQRSPDSMGELPWPDGDQGNVCYSLSVLPC